MPERTGYEPGTPSWVDIGTDVEAAKSFYGTLFGWTAEEAGPAEETGGYGFFFKDGSVVAGYGPQQNPGPPFWTTYVTVSDADDIAKRVEKAGGTAVVSPMQVMTAGRMAVFQDAQQAFFAVWEPGDHKGAALVNEPGALCWTELSTRDVEGAKAFYQAVFGWDPVTQAMGGMSYTEFMLNGASIAGMMETPPNVPANVPPHWLVYFAVDNTDGTVTETQRLGGSVLMPAMDTPIGRFAVLTDPQGAAFGVIKLADPPD